MGIELSKASKTIPHVSNIKNYIAFQDYPKCKLSQIREAHTYWKQSSLAKHISLTLMEFEEVFGQLFPDPVLHFDCLKQCISNQIYTCITLDVFAITILLCDGSMENKLRTLLELNPEINLNNIRIDSLQFLIYRILQAMQTVFMIEVSPRDILNEYVDMSIQQYMERNALINKNAAADKTALLNASSKSAGVDNTSTPTPKNKSPSKAKGRAFFADDKGDSTLGLGDERMYFTAKDLWQWTQDVYVVYSYLEAIQDICQQIIHFFANEEYTRSLEVDEMMEQQEGIVKTDSKTQKKRPTRNTQIRASFPKITRSFLMSSNTPSLQNALHHSIIQELHDKRMHVLWKEPIESMYSDRWLQNIVVDMTTEHKVFTVLEHMLLSTHHIIPIYQTSMSLIYSTLASLYTNPNGMNNPMNPSPLPPSNNRFGSVSATTMSNSRTNSIAYGGGAGNTSDWQSSRKTSSLSNNNSGNSSRTNSMTVAAGSSAINGGQTQGGGSVPGGVVNGELVSIVDYSTIIYFMLNIIPKSVLRDVLPNGNNNPPSDTALKLKKKNRKKKAKKAEPSTSEVDVDGPKVDAEHVHTSSDEEEGDPNNSRPNTSGTNGAEEGEEEEVEEEQHDKEPTKIQLNNESEILRALSKSKDSIEEMNSGASVLLLDRKDSSSVELSPNPEDTNGLHRLFSQMQFRKASTASTNMNGPEMMMPSPSTASMANNPRYARNRRQLSIGDGGGSRNSSMIGSFGGYGPSPTAAGGGGGGNFAISELQLQWQLIGEKIANSPVLAALIVQQTSPLVLHFPSSSSATTANATANPFTADMINTDSSSENTESITFKGGVGKNIPVCSAKQSIYNIIYYYAQGYSYIPVLSDTNCMNLTCFKQSANGNPSAMNFLGNSNIFATTTNTPSAATGGNTLGRSSNGNHHNSVAKTITMLTPLVSILQPLDIADYLYQQYIDIFPITIQTTTFAQWIAASLTTASPTKTSTTSSSNTMSKGAAMLMQFVNAGTSSTNQSNNNNNTNNTVNDKLIIRSAVTVPGTMNLASIWYTMMSHKIDTVLITTSATAHMPTSSTTTTGTTGQSKSKSSSTSNNNKTNQPSSGTTPIPHTASVAYVLTYAESIQHFWWHWKKQQSHLFNDDKNGVIKLPDIQADYDLGAYALYGLNTTDTTTTTAIAGIATATSATATAVATEEGYLSSSKPSTTSLFNEDVVPKSAFFGASGGSKKERTSSFNTIINTTMSRGNSFSSAAITIPIIPPSPLPATTTSSFSFQPMKPTTNNVNKTTKFGCFNLLMLPLEQCKEQLAMSFTPFHSFVYPLPSAISPYRKPPGVAEGGPGGPMGMAGGIPMNLVSGANRYARMATETIHEEQSEYTTTTTATTSMTESMTLEGSSYMTHDNRLLIDTNLPFSDQAGTMTPFHPFPQPPSTAGPHTVSVGDTDGVHPSGDGTTSTTTPAAPTPVPPQGKKGKGGGRGGHTAASQYFLQQQQRERAIHLSQQKADQARRTEQWYRTMKVLTPQDTLKEALFLMIQAKVTTVFIVDPLTGQAVGMLTLKDICTHLIYSEAKDKIKWQSMQNTSGGGNTNATSNAFNSNNKMRT